ncbi:MAG: C40 family peptidase [Lachnospiraceae bacterium]|nr:C40 family peptidase [Lachnospiraceae bacterium]
MIRNVLLKTSYFVAILIMEVLFAMPVYAATSGELYTAGATSVMETGKMETVSTEKTLISTAGSGDVESVYKAALSVQKEEVIAGYTNLGIANVTDHLNVRKEANENADLVGKMTKNAACEIQEIDGAWAHIKSGKVDGYVNTEFLLTGDEAKTRAMQVMRLVATVTTTTLFVRDEPNTNSSIITMVPMDEKLDITEGVEGDPWVKIEIDQDVGYVSTDYVTISEELDKAMTLKELKYGQGMSDLRVSLVNYAMQFIGNPYVWGGTSLTKGADCSGYVQSIFKKYGYSLPRTSREQAKVGTKISLADAQPGDLVFYGKGGTVNHVGIYIGNGQIVNASNRRTGIKVSNATYRTPYAVRRVLP